MTAGQSTQSAGVPIASPSTARSWWCAALPTACAIYGPQLLMCLYTLFWVSCGHCKLAVWQVAPIAPGLFLYETGRRILDLPHFSSEIGITLTIALSVLVLAALTAWVRHAGRWWLAILIPVTLASGFLAVALLGAIRS